jgi:hypothetical protein
VCEGAEVALQHGIDGQRETTTGGLKPDEDCCRARGGEAAEDVDLHMEAATARPLVTHCRTAVSVDALPLGAISRDPTLRGRRRHCRLLTLRCSSRCCPTLCRGLRALLMCLAPPLGLGFWGMGVGR